MQRGGWDVKTTNRIYGWTHYRRRGNLSDSPMASGMTDDRLFEIFKEVFNITMPEIEINPNEDKSE